MPIAADIGNNAAPWLLLAISLGALVGLERRMRGHPACLLAGIVLFVNIVLHFVEHTIMKQEN